MKSMLLPIVFSIALAQAQTYTISTFAGGLPPLGPVPGWDVSIATDVAGNAYFTSRNCVFKRDPNGIVTRIAGNARPGYSGDYGPAINAELNVPLGVAVDRAGNVFIADTQNHLVRKVLPDGIIVPVAGTGVSGFSGDGGPAVNAQMSYPVGLTVDGAGNLFIVDAIFIGFSDTGNRIRKISPEGIITTVAGKGNCSDCSSVNSGDGGPATEAILSGPNRVAVDSIGNLYVTEPLNGRVRVVSPDGFIDTVAGNSGLGKFGQSCSAGSGGDGKRATEASLCLPYGVAVDATGNLFIAEYGYRCCYDLDDPVIENFAVRQVTQEGIVSTVAGSATPGVSVCNCADIGSGFVAVDANDNLYVSDSVLIARVSLQGIAATIADSSSCCFSGDGGLARAAQLYGPNGVAADSAGNLFIADTYNNRIRKVSPDGIITTVAGNGTYGYSGDAGPAINAQVNDATGVAVDGAGDLFIADRGNYRVRKVLPDGTIATIAGGGTEFGDNGPATDAGLTPSSVAVDGDGNLFIGDLASHRVRKVSPNGTITTVAGGGGPCPCLADDGSPATQVRLGGPNGLAVDRAGNIYFGDGARIRKVAPDGIIATVAGNGQYGFSGDGGRATEARLSTITAVTVDGLGNLFIADAVRIRKVSADAIISTIAGNGDYGYRDDRGRATEAQLASSAAVAVDSVGDVYLAEPSLNAIRVLLPEKRRTRMQQSQRP